MTVVLDANVVFELVNAPSGMDLVAADDPVAPPLLWPEVRCALHVARARGLLDDQDATIALDELEAGGVKERRHRRLGAEAWRIADALGWAKTYDAEYLALAKLLRVPLATFDGRVSRAAERLGIPIHDLG